MAERTRRCEIRFTESEYHNLMEKAKKAGISVSALIRKSVDDCEVKAAPPADLHKLIWEIRRVGNNIDQILMIANARGLLDLQMISAKTIAAKASSLTKYLMKQSKGDAKWMH